MTQKYCNNDYIAITLEILIINTFFILILFEINNPYKKFPKLNKTNDTTL